MAWAHVKDNLKEEEDWEKKRTPKHTATSNYKKGNRNNKMQTLVYTIKVQVRKKRTFLWWHMGSAQIQKNKDTSSIYLVNFPSTF